MHELTSYCPSFLVNQTSGCGYAPPGGLELARLTVAAMLADEQSLDQEYDVPRSSAYALKLKLGGGSTTDPRSFSM